MFFDEERGSDDHAVCAHASLVPSSHRVRVPRAPLADRRRFQYHRRLDIGEKLRGEIGASQRTSGRRGDPILTEPAFGVRARRGPGRSPTASACREPLASAAPSSCPGRPCARARRRREAEPDGDGVQRQKRAAGGRFDRARAPPAVRRADGAWQSGARKVSFASAGPAGALPDVYGIDMPNAARADRRAPRRRRGGARDRRRCAAYHETSTASTRCGAATREIAGSVPASTDLHHRDIRPPTHCARSRSGATPSAIRRRRRSAAAGPELAAYNIFRADLLASLPGALQIPLKRAKRPGPARKRALGSDGERDELGNQGVRAGTARGEFQEHSRALFLT